MEPIGQIKRRRKEVDQECGDDEQRRCLAGEFGPGEVMFIAKCAPAVRTY